MVGLVSKHLIALFYLCWELIDKIKLIVAIAMTIITSHPMNILKIQLWDCILLPSIGKMKFMPQHRTCYQSVMHNVDIPDFLLICTKHTQTVKMI